MNVIKTEFLICCCLLAAVVLGVRLRTFLPEQHLSAESRDAIKLALGLVATMTAILLGLLVSSAKTTYDTERNEVVQIAAKITFLNRLLTIYGPEAEPVRVHLRDAVAASVKSARPEMSESTLSNASQQSNGEIYLAIQNLPAHDDMQRGLKAQAAATLIDVGQLQTLLMAQSLPSISMPLLVALVSWLFVIFLGFSMLAPSNMTTTVILVASVFSVAIAVFLIVELDQPMRGVIRISSEPILNALDQFPK
ncbi:MAG TPA: hypothetical protein VMH87_12490 [Pseudomonadales bacterium]|nr:hypothetical protein [Pseudomonadales bacterium]